VANEGAGRAVYSCEDLFAPCGFVCLLATSATRLFVRIPARAVTAAPFFVALPRGGRDTHIQLAARFLRTDSSSRGSAGSTPGPIPTDSTNPRRRGHARALSRRIKPWGPQTLLRVVTR